MRRAPAAAWRRLIEKGGGDLAAATVKLVVDDLEGLEGDLVDFPPDGEVFGVAALQSDKRGQRVKAIIAPITRLMTAAWPCSSCPSSGSASALSR